MAKNTVTPSQIDEIVANSDIKTYKLGEKTTLVQLTTAAGFVIIESSSCVDPANFDEVIGYEICIDRIKNKLWELEGYALQKKVYNDGLN